jgi:hypothetical protein
MIKFGSRTELTLAKWLEPKIQVKIGDMVRGASDVIALLGNPIQTEKTTVVSDEVEPMVHRETPA